MIITCLNQITAVRMR